MKNNIFIYGLYTDKEGIRYIGKTNKQDITKRLNQHILQSKKTKTHKDNWIQKSIKNGLKIKIKIIECVNKNNWEEKEKKWIKQYRKNKNITNHSSGGCGGREIKYTKSYNEIKFWVQKNTNIKSRNDWDKKIKLINKPSFIPISPRDSYLKRGWISWGDFLGTGKECDNYVNYLSYKNAKIYIKKNLYHIKTLNDWKISVKKKEIPKNIPNRPERYYKNKNKGWSGYGDFLGTGTVSNKNKKFVDYKECCNYVRKLKIRTKKEWILHCKNKIKKKEIPSNPDKKYKNNGWVNWNVFFNNNKISDNKKHENYLNYFESKEYIKKNYNFLKSSCQWENYFKKEKNILPKNIPLNPQISYKKNGWCGWGMFLDTGNIINKHKDFINYNKARKIVSKFKLKSNKEWRKFSKNERKKLNIPSNPDKVYKNVGWVDWFHWLSK